MQQQEARIAARVQDAIAAAPASTTATLPPSRGVATMSAEVLMSLLLLMLLPLLLCLLLSFVSPTAAQIRSDHVVLVGSLLALWCWYPT